MVTIGNLFDRVMKKNSMKKKKNEESIDAESVKEKIDAQVHEELNQEAEVTEAVEEPVTVEADLLLKLAEMQDKHLRLQAEFDNYRKRTLKEKADLIKTGGESVLINVLSVIDDVERALVAIETTKDIEATHEGIKLIFGKFSQFLSQNGVQEIEAVGQTFDTDKHEAITNIPAPSEDMKGKVVDVIQKGYVLQDKVIRFAKVVVGE
jgi:molecular chaperone GrpE